MSEGASIQEQPLLIKLSNGDLRVSIALEAGGSIASFYRLRHGIQTHWLRPASELALKNKSAEGMASFPMIPFCNRIRDGKAVFDGRQVSVPSGARRHPLHGFGWTRAWSCVQHEAASASLHLDFPGPDNDNGGWPFKFKASQHVSLTEQGLFITMEVKNTDNVPMPLGIGHHPYFVREPDTRLTLSAQGMWQGDHEVMPTTLDQPPLLQKLKEGIRVDDFALDNNFAGWDRIANVTWPASDAGPARSMKLQASSPFDYVVLYTPAGQDFFCVEPASNCTDWLNLASHTQAEKGGAVVAPGEVYTAGFSLLVD
ncbi:aldose 1-epimerase [Undibacterium terreum]|uniref:Aldose 1-epimerase n=1 Tax=Undibacterium terreum TaxID=1224302 RepID=A0A916XMK2_9BURK|nr:aldose 1-epimerase [Undibacterium terreum]GGC84330.1 aldose 1-epimerase [Undibacterium terreum]